MKRVLAALSGLMMLSGELAAECHAQQRKDEGSVSEFQLADLMSVMQARHLKLGYAAVSRNWPLARYEIGLMQQSFDAAARSFPTIGNLSLADLVKTISTPALADVAQAVDKQDQTRFFVAFKKLTDACNSCHQASGVGFITIRVPTASPFYNQSFAPASK